MKNGDAIRSMTDEKLADFLLRKEHHCPDGHTSTSCIENETCEGCWLAWLKQPAVDIGACSANETSEKVQGGE